MVARWLHSAAPASRTRIYFAPAWVMSPMGQSPGQAIPPAGSPAWATCCVIAAGGGGAEGGREGLSAEEIWGS